jgi:hypothetical protein
VVRHIFQACPVWIYTQSNITSIMTYVVLVVRMWILSIYRFLKRTWYADIVLLSLKRQRTSEQWDAILFLFTLWMYYIFNMQIYKFHHIYLSNCAFNVSCRLIFEYYLKYWEWLIIGLVAKYVESRYNIVDVVFALYKHFIKQSPSS